MTKARILADYVAGGTTAAEFDYMDGVTSNVQTQLDAKAPTASPTFTGNFTSVGIDDNADTTVITIDSSEHVGINATSPRTPLEIVQSAWGTGEGIRIAKTLSEYWDLSLETDAYNRLAWTNYHAGRVMTMTNEGNVGIGDVDTPSTRLQVYQDGNDKSVASFYQTHASGPYGYSVRYTGCSPDDGDHWFAYMRDSTAARFMIVSDGDVQNHDNSYGQTSDERIKQDIKDANSQWDDIKTLKVRNFKRKDDVKQYGENAWEQIGVVAQEVELISPKLVKECVPSDFELEHCGFGEQNSDGEWIPKKDSDGNNMTVKGMKYSVLYMKAIKALQEAMERIEQLEAKVTTLENA